MESREALIVGHEPSGSGLELKNDDNYNTGEEDRSGNGWFSVDSN